MLLRLQLLLPSQPGITGSFSPVKAGRRPPPQAAKRSGGLYWRKSIDPARGGEAAVAVAVAVAFVFVVVFVFAAAARRVLNWPLHY